jgi:hypothetical protein
VRRNRRTYSRIEASWQITLFFTDGVKEGKVKNISLGGALIRCSDLPKEDKAFGLLIEIPEYVLPVWATVKKVRLNNHVNDTCSLSYEMAIRFIDISADDTSILCKAMEFRVRTGNCHPKAEKTRSRTIEKGLVESMERLSLELKRPFKDLLEEAMDDLVKKYKKDRLIRKKEAVAYAQGGVYEPRMQGNIPGRC